MGLPRERDHDAHTFVGRYALHDKIASGGMATVHLGRLLGPVGFSRTVAIKRMLPQFISDPGFVSMFVDEARLASRIRHPNVVPTLDVVAQDGELFLVLEYVHGETLSKLIKAVHAKNDRIPPEIAAAIVCGMLHGLHAAHNVKNERGTPLGLVHRDVSPQNVLVGTDGTARLLDFGVAKAAGRLQITTKGQVKGKLAYMAPEQVKGAVTPQSDVYAASAVLWEALTCQRLFEHVTWSNLAQVMKEREVEAPSRVMGGIPAGLDAIVMRGLEKQAHRRFPTALDMALAIEGCVRVATAHELGEWVAETAGEVLERRAQKIAEIESQSSDFGGSTVAAMVLHESVGQGPPLDDRAEMATRADNGRPAAAPRAPQVSIEEAGDGKSGTPFMQISTMETTRRSEEPGSSRRQRATGTVAITILCAALGAFYLVRTHRLDNLGIFHRASATSIVQPAPPPVEKIEKAPPPEPAPPIGVDPASLAIDTAGPASSSSASPAAQGLARPGSKRGRPATKHGSSSAKSAP